MPAASLIAQTIYAELLERCANAAFDDAFSEAGSFTSKMVRERRYWYFQSAGADRVQRYVGPETPELLEKIARHKQFRHDERERHSLVSTLVRSFNLPRPVPDTGQLMAALAKAGVFRLRGVLVGTAAYQTYSAILGMSLPIASLQTNDIDIARFANVSVAIEDTIPPILDVLKGVDTTFRAVPSSADGLRTTSYAAASGLRVDFLTPNKGPDTDQPQALPALMTDAQPLGFLDFLIHEPEPAVILHQAGILVQVPTPARYAVHKLIVAERRRQGSGKQGKDLRQAETLLRALAEKRPYDLKSAWDEAYAKGPKWGLALTDSLGQLDAITRDSMLKLAERSRSTIRAIDLTFENPPARYDTSRDVVTFAGKALNAAVPCAVSLEALEDHFAADGLGRNGNVEIFQKNRSTIEAMARAKYLSWPIEEPNMVLIKTADVPKLLTEIRTSGRS